MNNQADVFWNKEAQILDWEKPWDKVSSWSFKSPVSVAWFVGGKLNVSYNCLDRHLEKRGDKPAIIWVPNDPQEKTQTTTYRQAYENVCRLANGLKELGVGQGDRVTIYLPLIPEALYSMLACARIGAVHSVVFGGFSSSALASRIQDCQSKVVITADACYRGTKRIELKKNVDEALATCPTVKDVLVVSRHAGKDLSYEELIKKQPRECEPTIVESTDPLFILYTSGSTGKPKGVLHGSGGYLTYAAHTFKHVFDYREEDIFWCTADVGWITGHSYVTYGPLANGATTLIYEGVPNYPDASRMWNIVDEHKVTIFYTAPTAIRALEREGDGWVKRTSRKSLRVLGTVGEPINPEAWRWYDEVVGEKRCPIVDTWWQTETGGILISPLAAKTKTKPGSATLPYGQLQPAILNGSGQELQGEAEGNLCLKNSWPGQMQTVFQDHERFEKTYFSQFPGYYFTGDGAKRDKDGYYWITGRIDDVINVSGHRIGTAEVESALVLHLAVVEAAVVGIPDDIKGTKIAAFVIVQEGFTYNTQIEMELKESVKKEIGSFAVPAIIQAVPGLPKTRSGKIMRRILKKIAAGETGDLGDTSTLADPGVVEQILKGSNS